MTARTDVFDKSHGPMIYCRTIEHGRGILCGSPHAVVLPLEKNTMTKGLVFPDSAEYGGNVLFQAAPFFQKQKSVIFTLLVR
jgi:hypothetical protein